MLLLSLSQVSSDGRDKKPFDSCFPFSSFLSDLLQDMRENAEAIAGAVSDLPCNIRREEGQSLVIGGSPLEILEGKGV